VTRRIIDTLTRTQPGQTAVAGLVLAGPGYNPADPGNAPGQAAVQQLLNTIAFYCGWVCLAAFAVGAAMWAIGGRVMHSGHGAAMGKLAMFTAVGGAILLGAGPAIIAWAIGLGTKA
jgi:hypothetical protein